MAVAVPLFYACELQAGSALGVLDGVVAVGYGGDAGWLGGGKVVRPLGGNHAAGGGVDLQSGDGVVEEV